MVQFLAEIGRNLRMLLSPASAITPPSTPENEDPTEM